MENYDLCELYAGYAACPGRCASDKREIVFCNCKCHRVQEALEQYAYPYAHAALNLIRQAQMAPGALNSEL